MNGSSKFCYCSGNIFSVTVVERNTNNQQPAHPIKLHSPPVSALVMLSKCDENIPKSMRAVSDHPVPITDMPKLNICLPKWARLNLSKTNLSIWIILSKIFQNITDVGEVYLIWKRLDGGDGPILMATRSRWKNHPGNSISSLNVLNLEPMRYKRLRIDGNVRHNGLCR